MSLSVSRDGGRLRRLGSGWVLGGSQEWGLKGAVLGGLGTGGMVGAS